MYFSFLCFITTQILLITEGLNKTKETQSSDVKIQTERKQVKVNKSEGKTNRTPLSPIHKVGKDLYSKFQEIY